MAKKLLPFPRIATATLTLDITPGAAEIQLTPCGIFRARDGRPEGLAGWKIDRDIAARVIAASQRKTPFVIDYEHQTILSQQNGQPAPASGWFTSEGLEWREGQGLYATGVAWTPKAAEMIQNGEYKFISPVISYQPETGEVLRVEMAALTNNPALDGMAAAALSHFFAAKNGDSAENTPHGGEAGTPQEKPVNELLKKLLAALGLPETGTEDEAFAALEDLKKKTEAESAPSDEAAALKAEVAQLKAQLSKQGTPDPALYVPIAALKTVNEQLAALRSEQDRVALEGVIQTALNEGRLQPAQETWAREFGAKDLASLSAFLKNAPVLAPLGAQLKGKTVEDESLDEAQMAVCKQMGLDPKAYAASLKTLISGGAA